MLITHEIYDKIPDKAKEIREKVFITEQGFENEFDETDNNAKHILLYIDGNAVAVGRFLTDDGIEYHIGRLAVLREYRGLQLGSKIMNACEQEIKALGGKRAVLSAQCRARGFYERNGYSAYGDIYFDEHVEHINMLKEL